MIDIPKLKGRIVECGLTFEDMAKIIGKSSKTFGKKMKKGVFDNIEIEKMVVALDIDNPLEYFFIRKVARNETDKN